MNCYNDGTQYIRAHTVMMKRVLAIVWYRYRGGRRAHFAYVIRRPTRGSLTYQCTVGCKCVCVDEFSRCTSTKRQCVKRARLLFTFRAHPHVHKE